MIPSILRNVPITHTRYEDLTRQEQLYLLTVLRSHQSNALRENVSGKFYDLPSSPTAAKPSSYDAAKTAISYPNTSEYPSVKKRKMGQPHTHPEILLKRARPEYPSSKESLKVVEHNRRKKILKSTRPVTQVTENDVLSGRGGATNVHVGNRVFRSLIDAHREKYLRAKKNDKPEISRSIVNIIRRRNGSFLKKDEDSGLFFEIGDDLAREKTSQALRQRAPDHRRRIMEEDSRKISSLRSTISKSTYPNSVITRPRTFALDHQSLAREYLAVKEKQAELQFHLQIVEELKQRLAVGNIII